MVVSGRDRGAFQLFRGGRAHPPFMQMYNPDRSSGGNETSRRVEADRLFGMIEPHLNRLSQKEQNFVESCDPDGGRPISSRMLFWLRDIKDRLL